MPGYGAGSAFFWRNFCGLASSLKIYAVDWLGTGLSGRPAFTATSRHDTEAFFLDSMVKWRHQLGMTTKMVLVGHSLGGYLSACYALKYPEHVEHLILVCPAGVPKEPEDWQRKFLGGASQLRSGMFKASMWAWESGITPQAIIRSLGPWGAQLCDGYVSRRFAGDIPPHEVEWFKRYFYHQLAAQGSGEYALRHLLSPGAWAHEPLQKRLRDLKVPVTFIYGKNDWMRPHHAVELCDELKKERQPKVSSDLHVSIIDEAGHFVFIDQPELFNKALIDACSMHMDKGTEQKASQAHAHAHATDHTATSTTFEHWKEEPRET
ncbi:Alpha/Beta hydrolase protein [Dunaliella salina]|uniref:Alpha/Beta hydrolase protein n=1 Tax=Dunaliella salina TaxID=3046 RepID=A0ABQ7H788_DUNSA|nr:Alpha/Beta hydrolase protein [Dunaliella salina]|eukprot:KAF5842719.1 Alpha/Beta hydrolase protein [Dunaliella salina]